MALYPFERDDTIICHCYGVTKYTIMKAVYDGNLREIEEVSAKTNAGNGCQSCHMQIQECIDEARLSMRKLPKRN